MSMANKTTSGDLQSALKNATELLGHDPRLAQEQAEEILKVYPDTPKAKRILAFAYRLQSMPQKGLDVLKPLHAEHHDSPDFLHEFAQCLGALGRGEEAVNTLRRSVSLDPKHAASWQSLGHQLMVAGDEDGSRQAFERHFELSTRHPELVEAVKLLRDGKLGKAEQIVRDLLKEYPTDVTAIRVLADIGIKVGHLQDASNLLERCLELAPDFHAARHSYSMVLMRLQQPEAALREVEKLLIHEPNNPNFLTVKGNILVRIGNHREAIEIYEKVLKDYHQ